MRWCKVIMLWTVIWLLCISPSSGMLAAQERQEAPAATPASDASPDLPDLADLIPLEAALPGRFARLKQKMGDLVDLTDVEQSLAAVDVSLESSSSQFLRLRASTGVGYYQFTALKTAIRSEQEGLAAVSAGLTETLRQLGVWRTTWLAEKQQWTTWQSSGRHDELLDVVKPTYVTAHLNHRRGPGSFVAADQAATRHATASQRPPGTSRRPCHRRRRGHGNLGEYRVESRHAPDALVAL